MFAIYCLLLLTGGIDLKTFVRVFFVIIIAAFIIFGGVIVHSNEIAANSPAKEKVYTSVMIQSGDSLWSIASEYCENSSDIPAYIDALKQMNSIKNERSLQAGNYLTVYYMVEK